MILFSQLDQYLEELYMELDIPENYYEKANTSYTSFNNWLARDDSKLKDFEPEIFLQGSFKLGTVIKPIGENDSYDIDMVCRFNNLSKQVISQQDLKALLGEEVLSYAESKGMINEPKDGKRCWTLNYHDQAKFHMDILPCVDDSKMFTAQLEMFKYATSTSHKEKAVAITDKRSKNYATISDEWEISNPQGYYLWFQEQSHFHEKQAMLLEQFAMKVEELQEYKVKTTLQKAIQILKRHRDIMFKDKVDKKPASIIISTLAAKAYRGGDNLRDVLKDIVDNMHMHIEENDGRYHVLNPVNPMENFADKWNTDRTLKAHFENWLKEARKNLTSYNESIDIYEHDFSKNISEQLGITEAKAMSMIDTSKSQEAIKKISYRQQPKWRMNNLVDVYIKATKTKKGFNFPKSVRSGEFLTKNVDLKFEAKSDEIKQYEVYWQVTNTGDEARSNSCLRGDFYDGKIVEGRRIRKETTSYVGTHIVECYLVKNNVCYGKSKPFIVNIKDGFSMDW